MVSLEHGTQSKLASLPAPPPAKLWKTRKGCKTRKTHHHVYPGIGSTRERFHKFLIQQFPIKDSLAWLKVKCNPFAISSQLPERSSQQFQRGHDSLMQSKCLVASYKLNRFVVAYTFVSHSPLSQKHKILHSVGRYKQEGGGESYYNMRTQDGKICRYALLL